MKKLIIIYEILIITLLLMTYFRVEAEPITENKYYLMVASGYCPCELCCGYWSRYGKTYLGHQAKKGCIAIDPDAGILRLNQRVTIPGYGEGICNDIGGAIKGWEVDLCFDSHQEAVEWGVKLVKVYVKEVK
jgi:3D (Asp-Asp-Asp) domain-containing protein